MGVWGGRGWEGDTEGVGLVLLHAATKLAEQTCLHLPGPLFFITVQTYLDATMLSLLVLYHSLAWQDCLQSATSVRLTTGGGS